MGCAKKRPYFIVHFISRVSIEYGRMLLSMMMIMCAVHRSQCCMSWLAQSTLRSCWPKNDYILTAYVALFSRHPNARKPFFEGLRYCIQRGVYPRLLSFQKLEFLGPFLMHWTDNTWPYFIIWWLGSFLQKDWLHLLEFQTLYPCCALVPNTLVTLILLENFGILEFFKSLNGHMYTSKKRVNSTSTIEPAAPHHHRI